MVDEDRLWLAKVNRRASDGAFKITNNISTIYVGILLNVYIVTFVFLLPSERVNWGAQIVIITALFD